jgi:hypothetical protein
MFGIRDVDLKFVLNRSTESSGSGAVSLNQVNDLWASHKELCSMELVTHNVL